MIGLPQYQEQAQKFLGDFFRAKRKELQKTAPLLLPFFDRTTEYMLRQKSKRLRGYLVCAGYQLVAGKLPAGVARLSIIAEMFHAYLLIEDDIIDRDEQRRGGKTLHIALAHTQRRHPDAKHLGMSHAVLLAGLLGIWARQLILASAFPLSRKHHVLRKAESMLEETHYGEMLDVLLASGSRATERDIVLVYLMKTARYTFEAPLHMGAILAGAPKNDLAALSRFAVPVGIAFQMQDDLLGLFGTKRQIGKPVTSDLEEQKKTLPFLYARQMLAPSLRKAFDRLLAQRPTRKSLAAVRRMVESSGARSACAKAARLMVENGKRALTGHTRFGIQGVSRLVQLADFVVRRTY